MALKRIWMPSPNYSSRSESGVRLIVLHTAEGARTIESLGNFFASSSAGVSSQVGADDKVNTVGEYVKRANKSWTQSEFNPVATSMELCGFASWSTDEWMNNHKNMLDNCAKWIAEEAAHFGVPIVKLSTSEAQGSGRGVCQHIDLGARGGGHVDCGSGFPYDHVLDMARGGAGATSTEGEDMIASAVAANGNLHVFKAKGDSLSYCWQAADKTAWSGGEAGKSVAGFSGFAKAPSPIIGVSASVADNGNLHVWVTCENGKTYYTWQAKDSSKWSGQEPGKMAALSLFAN